MPIVEAKSKEQYVLGSKDELPEASRTIRMMFPYDLVINQCKIRMNDTLKILFITYHKNSYKNKPKV